MSFGRWLRERPMLRGVAVIGGAALGVLVAASVESFYVGLAFGVILAPLAALALAYVLYLRDRRRPR